MLKGRSIGRVRDARADIIYAHLPTAKIGQAVELLGAQQCIRGTVQSIDGGIASISPHADVEGLKAGDAVHALGSNSIPVLRLSALGTAIDVSGPTLNRKTVTSCRPKEFAIQPSPADRTLLRAPLWTGIKAIDGLLTFARGARFGIFGPAGAGKSSLLAMLQGNTRADVSVVALIGERGREASEWFTRLNPRMSVVYASSDRPAAERVAAAHCAIQHAAYLRDLGLHVLLVVDSLARLAAALRDVAIGCGEPVGRAGFPASVFTNLARFVEVGGATAQGSVTIAATILSTDADRDPITEAARALLDGHIVLSRALANAGRFPAIDITTSASRLMGMVASATHAEDAVALRRAIAALSDSEEARSIGLPSHDPWVNSAQQNERQIEEFLRQGAQAVPAAVTVRELQLLAERLRP